MLSGDDQMERFDGFGSGQGTYEPKNYDYKTSTNTKMSFANGALTSMRDGYGNGFDVKPDSITSATTGQKVTIIRDSKTNLITEIDQPDSNKRTYIYNDANELIQATDFAGHTQQYVYGADHLIERIIDGRGLILSRIGLDSSWRKACRASSVKPFSRATRSTRKSWSIFATIPMDSLSNALSLTASINFRRACALCGAPHKAHYLESVFIWNEGRGSRLGPLELAAVVSR